MPFTVDDFSRLMQALEAHPEWRADLRRQILSAEVLELPVLMGRLIEAQARTEQRVGAVEEQLTRLAEAQARTEQRVSDLAEAQVRTEQRVGDLIEAQARTEQRLDAFALRLDALTARLEENARQLAELTAIVRVHTDKIGSLEGRFMEWEYEKKAPAYFYTVARRVRTLDASRLADLLDDAEEAGRISAGEREQAMHADVVMTGRRREDGAQVYILAEVSVGVGVRDVARAKARAAILEKLGRPAVPVVAGERITAEAAVYAQGLGVMQLLRSRESGDDIALPDQPPAPGDGV